MVPPTLFVPVLLGLHDGLADLRERGEVQHARRSEASSHLAGVADVALDEVGAGRDALAEAGGQVVEDDTSWPASSRCCGDHAADITRAAGDQVLPAAMQLATSRSRSAARLRRHVVDEHAHAGLGTREELQLAGSAADGEKLEVKREVVAVTPSNSASRRTAPGARRRCTASAARPRRRSGRSASGVPGRPRGTLCARPRRGRAGRAPGASGRGAPRTASAPRTGTKATQCSFQARPASPAASSRATTSSKRFAPPVRLRVLGEPSAASGPVRGVTNG